MGGWGGGGATSDAEGGAGVVVEQRVGVLVAERLQPAFEAALAPRRGRRRVEEREGVVRRERRGFFFLISPGGHTQPPPVGELRRSGSDWPTLRGSILHRLGRVGAGEGRHVEEAVVELHRDEVGEQHGGEVGKRSSEECWSAPSVGAPPEAYCGPAGSILVGIARFRLSYHFAQVPPLPGSAVFF